MSERSAAALKDHEGDKGQERPVNVQVLKTKAETALATEIASGLADLPGGAAVRRLRTEAAAQFAGLGLPHRRIEEWKYTDLRGLLREAYPFAIPEAGDAGAGWAGEQPPLLELRDAIRVEFVDDTCVRGARRALPAGVSVEPLSRLLDEEPAWLVTELKAVELEGAEATLALNTATMAEGAVIRIAAGTRLAKPIHLAFAAGRLAPASIGLRNVVIIEDGASAVLVESYSNAAGAPRQRHAITQVVLGREAEFTHVQVVACEQGSAHIGATAARIGRSARYRPFQFTSGTGTVRHDIRATFAGEHANFDLGSALMLSQEGHADTTLVVDHAVPHCTSRELVKAVLDGRARGIFQGKVIVRPDAQKTDGKQMAQALMLAPDVEFDSKPELEIYADDVVCAHGSTVAEIDQDLLFYCASRGIPNDVARALLIESFVGEAIDKVEDEPVREALMALAQRVLSETYAGAREIG